MPIPEGANKSTSLQCNALDKRARTATVAVHMLPAVAENEARMISERTRVELAAAKRRGTRFGGFRGRIETDADRRRAAAGKTTLANSRVSDLADTLKTLKAEGVTSYRAIAGRFNAMNIRGRWRGAQVARVLVRLHRLSSPSKA